MKDFILLGDENLIRVGGRKTTDPSFESLSTALLKALRKTADSFKEDFGKTAEKAFLEENVFYKEAELEDFPIYDIVTSAIQENATISKDISKISFDFENTCFSKSDVFPKDSDDMRFIGFQKLPNGLNFFGVCAGGDWELSVYFILYFDGKKLRGYIPAYGNCYNQKNKMAIGNDEDSDYEVASAAAKKFAAENGLSDEEMEDIEPVERDIDMMLRDIESRIEIVK